MSKQVAHRVKKTEQVTHKAVSHQSFLSALSRTVSVAGLTPHMLLMQQDQTRTFMQWFLAAVLWDTVFSGHVFRHKHVSECTLHKQLECTLATWPKMRSLRHADNYEAVTSRCVSATLQWLSALMLWNACKKDLCLWFASATDCVHSCSTSADRRSFLSHFHPACAACRILLADLTGPVQTQAVDGWKLVSIISHFVPVWRTAWQCVYTDVGLAGTGWQRAQGSTHGVGRKHWLWFSSWAGKKRA